MRHLAQFINAIENDDFRVFIDPKVKETYKYDDGVQKYIWMPTIKRICVQIHVKLESVNGSDYSHNVK
jgi:hypothetical protein